nr:hypothetical protein Itr_chr07CG00040 [Ipomoea trifida]
MALSKPSGQVSDMIGSSESSAAFHSKQSVNWKGETVWVCDGLGSRTSNEGTGRTSRKGSTTPVELTARQISGGQTATGLAAYGVGGWQKHREASCPVVHSPNFPKSLTQIRTSRAVVDRALISHSHSAIPIRQSGRARIAIHHQSATEQSRRRAPIARHGNRRRFYEFQQRRLPQRTPRLHQQRRRPPRLLLRTPVADAVRRPRRPQVLCTEIEESRLQITEGSGGSQNRALILLWAVLRLGCSYEALN